MRPAIPVYFLFVFALISCNSKTESVNTSRNFKTLTKGSPSIAGKQEYLPSPFLTAGDRVYIVGHQDGSFPEIGWHIPDEMGGIWNHPIKLMDGFDVTLDINGEIVKLDKANSFVNYPYSNQHFYSIEKLGLEVERWQFVPDGKEGLLVQFILSNTTNSTQDIALTFTGHSDLSPTWLGEKTNMIDSKDEAEYSTESDLWLVKDSLNSWFVGFGSDNNSLSNSNEQNTYKGNGASASLRYSISVLANNSTAINFTIAGSYNSKEACLATYSDIQNNYISLIEQKRKRYESLANRSKLTIPDKTLQQTFEWLKYNSDWLIRTVPEIGSGITAGIPDYPWWFGVDSEYALKGYMAVGQKEAVYNTISLLDSISMAVNGNGKIVHEVSSNGYVFNEGNINETPQFASLIWEIFRWIGDVDFLKKYAPTIDKGLEWLMTENDKNENLFPDGFGMMEIHGMNSEMIDVAAYTQRAFDDASKIASALGNEELSTKYQNTAAKLKEKINIEFWSEEFNSYADFIGTDEQALHLIDAAIVRADTLNKPWAIAELEETKKAIEANPSSQLRPFVTHHNWVVNTPMEMAIASNDKAIKALITGQKFVNPFGVFVTGIDRDESAGSDDGTFKGSKIFSYTGAVMTLPTGVQIVAENNYDRPDQALSYLKKMTRSFSYAFPGSMYEVSPDYGMITQAWNIYSYAVPIVQQFFGIQPSAINKTVDIRLQMPSEWKDASLENVAVADNELSIFYSRTDGQLNLRVTQSNPEWTINLEFDKNKLSSHEIVSGNVDAKDVDDMVLFNSQDKEIQLKIMD